jgi:hypothetical protein
METTLRKLMIPLMACALLAACGDTGGGASNGTPLPKTDDIAEIERIAGTLSEEGKFSDRAMFESFMSSKELAEKGMLQTDDPDRFKAATVEEAIAKHRALKQESAAELADAEKRRKEGDVTIAKADCEEIKKVVGDGEVEYPNGYEFGGEKYPSSCAAYEANM